MTEKRFVNIAKEPIFVVINDNLEDKVFADDDVVDLLNALHEENKILKNKIGTYHSANELLKETIDRLRSDG